MGQHHTNDVKTILIYVGLDLLGDGLLKMPFICGLRRHFPTAKITWLAGQGPTVFSSLLSSMVKDKIDEIIECANIGVSFKEIFSPHLPDRYFDLIIDTQKSFFTTLAIKKIPHRTFISQTMNFLFSDIKPNHKQKMPKNLQEQFRVFLELAAGANTEGYSPVEITHCEKSQRLSKTYFKKERCYIGLAPGAGGKHKCWPLENFIETGRILLEKGKTPVYFLGPNETEMENIIRSRLPHALLPLQDLREDMNCDPLFTLALAKNMCVNITNDAGVGHICSMSAKPQIMLFGPTPPEKFKPAGDHIHTIQAQQFGGSEMSLINVESVVSKIEELIN